jgi:hypothetical protein
MDEQEDVWKIVPEKYEKTKCIRDFERYYNTVLAHFKKSEPNLKSAKNWFKVAEIVFKIMSWLIAVSIFKVVAEKTHSTLAYCIHVSLLVLVWGVLSTSASVFEFNFSKSPVGSKRTKYNYIILLGFVFVLQLLMMNGLTAIIAELVAAKMDEKSSIEPVTQSIAPTK